MGSVHLSGSPAGERSGAAGALRAQQTEAARQSARQQEEQTRQNSIRLFEARKPFIEKRFQLYNETAATVGKLVTLDRKSAEWETSSVRFWQLYWSELSVVEDRDVENAMVKFGERLHAYSRQPEVTTRIDLEQGALDLARAIRTSIENSWRVQ